MLFDPQFHEPLTTEPWARERALAAIGAIAADAEVGLDDEDWWPVHPLDETTTQRLGPLGLKVGAAGMLWGLDALGRSGLTELRRDYSPYAERLPGAYASAPKHPARPEFFPETSLWGGETGVLLVSQRLAPSPDRADALHDRIVANVGDETNSLIWGSPGAMLAAEAMIEWTGEERWERAWLELADHLWHQWRPARRFGCRLWGMREPDGQFRAHLGAIGLAGNAGVLAHRRARLGPDRAAELDDRAVEAVSRFALRDDGLANWAPWAGLEEATDRVFMIRWCNGAPGVICSLAGVAPGDETLDELLIAGGELTWRAGPPSVGPGLCCGTSGAGFAFLNLHGRTGDARWLERARAFAMHAIGQVERSHRHYGRGRFSLWTGDLGVAFFLAECLNGSARFPTIDLW